MDTVNRLGMLACLVAAGALGPGCSKSKSDGGGGGGTTYAISGSVSGAWVAGVTVALGGAATATATTDASGAYAFASLANGTYTLTPSLAGYTFTPASATVTVSGADQTQAFASASTVPAFEISGTVTYAGAKTGRVYLVATSTGGKVRGTSIAAPGAYTIRGVTPGTWAVTARLDVLGHGAANAGDPVGATASTVEVSAASVSGADVTLADPATPSADVPTGLVAAPGAGCTLLFWEVAGYPGTEKATSYDLSWGTNPGASNLGVITGIGARDDTHYVHTGLTDGNHLYYKVRSNVGAAPSAWSSILGPVTVGAVPGAYAVSGTVSFDGTATGPLYLAVQDAVTQQMRVAAYAAPVSPVAFSVTGVESGRHVVYAILDQNANHVVDEGDLANTGDAGGGVVVDVAGATTGVAVALGSAKGVARTATQHVAPPTGTGFYLVDHRVADGVRRAVAVTITSGRDLPLPLDVARTSGFDVWMELGATAPTVGDAVGYSVTYDDGTTEALGSTVTAVLDAFPTALAETTTGPHSPGVPLLSWAAPASAPASYGYLVQVFGGGANWYYPDASTPLPSTTTSVEYDYDGGASPSTLPAGTYTWGVTVVDAGGNRATQQKTYVVP